MYITPAGTAAKNTKCIVSINLPDELKICWRHFATNAESWFFSGEGEEVITRRVCYQQGFHKLPNQVTKSKNVI